MAKRGLTRRRFVGTAAAAAGWCLAAPPRAMADDDTTVPVSADGPVPNVPIGVAKGLKPGRVIWGHDPQATRWEGPGQGHWWESAHTNAAAVHEMTSHALRELVDAERDSAAWDRLFRHFNQTHGKGSIGYRPGEKITIKVNFVGLVWRWPGVNPETYELEKLKDYMNTSPQVMLALLRQLVETVGVRQTDITIGDSLALFANQYHEILHAEFPNVQYLDHKGAFGRIAEKPSVTPLYWSSRPEGCLQDYAPASFAQADYLINVANLKSHSGAGVTLCGKNHFGSLVRWPAQEGYFDLHPNSFGPGMGKYRNVVDLMGHAHIGGKTLLNLIDGLYAGRHPVEKAPRKWNSPPFNGDWSSSLLFSQDPVAIDSVAFDFLRTEWNEFPHKSGAEDYLHEAAQADDPPSHTFYDPNHDQDNSPLASLGVHEHWNNPKDRQYSRNLGTGEGIELVTVGCEG